jgi:phenylacetic acid degradation operon negative regulatory protein
MMSIDVRSGTRRDARSDLDAAVCSDGAPSARNLLVTVFGDVLLTAGPDTETTVQALTSVLAGFRVNERLVRTSLSRLVHDDLLAVRSAGRRSFYRVSPCARDLFARADERIYRGRPEPWDGAWTLVVLDGAESTAEHRAALRHELAALGLGVVAPNVLGSPVVGPAAVAGRIARVGGVEHVVVTRGPLVAGPGLVEPLDLVRRCLDLAALETAYGRLADRLAAYDAPMLSGLDGDRAAKLRLLVVATFRRLALADPMLPDELLGDDWPGHRARQEARRVYAAVAPLADRWFTDRTGQHVATDPSRFAAG